MTAIIKQNGETRLCKLELGQRVKHPEGFWGRISMFGEDDNQQPRILMTNESISISRKRGAYPDEVELLESDFESGNKIF